MFAKTTQNFYYFCHIYVTSAVRKWQNKIKQNANRSAYLIFILLHVKRDMTQNTQG